MALFVPGMACALCGVAVKSAGEAFLFSPFIADRSDPLFVLSDAVVHAVCLREHPLANEAKKWSDEATLRRNVTERPCAACGRPVRDPNDFFTTGLLSRDSENPLFAFNFVILHQSHAASWSKFDAFRRRMEAAQADDGSWKGPRLVFGTSPLQTLRWVARE